jgi:TP901 family phage tail tape measure protein
MGATVVRSLIAKFGFQPDLSGLERADRAVDNAKTHTDRLGKSMRGLAGDTGRAGKSVQDMLSGVAIGAAAYAGFGAIKRELGEAVDASLAFGESMGKIQSLIPGNTQRTLEYKDAIQSLSVQYGQSQADVAAGAYDVISTFGDTADAIDQVALAVKVGAAGAATTKDGIALLGGVTKAYGDTSTKTMQQVADLGFQTVNLGKVELPELASSMGIATPLAANLGVKMEELFAIMASASGVTGSGSEVMTQTSSAMQALVKQTPQMKKAWKAVFGKEGVKDAISRDGIVGVFQKLVGHTDGSIESIDKLFGRIEGLKLILQLTQKGAGDFSDKMTQMKNASGATDIAFAAMRGGLAATAAKTKQTEVKMTELKTEIGDRVAPVVADFNADLATFADLVATDVLPSIDKWNADPMDTQGMSDFKTVAEGVADVLLVIVGAADLALAAVREIGSLGGRGLGALWSFTKLDGNGVMDSLNGALTDSEEIAKGLYTRNRKRYYAITDPDFAKQQIELRKVGAESVSDRYQMAVERNSAVAGNYGLNPIQDRALIAQIAGTTINVNLPAGSQEDMAMNAAKHIVPEIRRQLEQAHANAPKRTNKSGTEQQWGMSGTNDAYAPGGE